MSEQPMTRRARRAAERAASQVGFDAPTPVVASDAPGPHTASVPASPIDGQADAPSHTAQSQGEPTEELVYTLEPRRRTRASVAGRLAILAVLGCVTVAGPLTSQLTPFGSVAAGVSVAETAAPLAVTGKSIAAAVLGSDADLDESSDIEMSNVPDAATLARIREAYESAPTTCAPQTSAASGDAAAVTRMPSVVYPMVEGTYTVSSPFGYRLHPTLGYLKLHTGQDFAAPTGTPIYAAAAGKVVKAGMLGDTGTIVIEHSIEGKTWYTVYMHMYESGIYVHEGDEVTVGQLIAGVGSTGRSTGAHLHFEVRTANNFEDSSAIDPAAWLEQQGAVQLTTDCS